MYRTTNIYLVFLLILFTCNSFASDIEEKNSIQNKAPFIGAQVFIEPGQTKEEINAWFKLMSDNNLTACRIRMFEAYMRDENYNWDFTLFDHAFKAAEKFNIKIWATLYFVAEENFDVGGEKFPRSEKQLQSIATYINKTVNHFKNYKSLSGWVLLNEPGVKGSLPDNDFTQLKLKEWENNHSYEKYNDKGFPILQNFKKEQFLVDYTTWFLNWIADEIKKYDTNHDLHVNNHDLFVNASEYNFPEWRKFISSLGGSAHPSWHFTYFERQKYAIAMSADCEMLLSGSGDLPWYMTEIQGGNNTYSSFAPMCPTAEEITQWLWITIGTEGKGAIFWTLNPRTSGQEAGEWAMIDFQGNATDRVKAAGKVAETIQEKPELFASVKKADSHINILYVREALWAEKQMTIWESPYAARENGAVMKSAMAYFEAFSEMGISPNFKGIHEFDFTKNDYKGETIILSHQISMPSKYVESLEHFVKNGGKLIVDGLTAFFDENMHNTMITGFDYKNLFGGNVSEFKFQKDIFNLSHNGNELPVHMWKGFVAPTTGEVVLNSASEKIGIRNKIEGGETLWIPSLLGLGSRIENDFSALQILLEKETQSSMNKQLVRFSKPHKNTLMKTLKSGDSVITIIVNKDKKPQNIELKFNKKVSVKKVLSSASEKKITGTTITVEPEETVVVLWE